MHSITRNIKAALHVYMQMMVHMCQNVFEKYLLLSV